MNTKGISRKDGDTLQKRCGYQIYKIIFLILVIFLSIAKGKILSDEFDLMPLNINFYGAVTSRTNIIAYGDNGAYLMTTDKGKTWKQHSLNEFGIIREIINYNDTLWGILDEGLLVCSFDNGLSWIKQKYVLEEREHFITLLANDNYIFVRSNKGIYRFDRGLNLLNYLKDTILGIDYKKIPYNYFPPYIFGYSRTLFFYNNKLNKLIISCDKFPDGFVLISEDLTSLDTISFKEKIYLKSSTYYILNVFTYKGKWLFNISGNLYLADDSLNNWSYFFPDTTFLNINDSLFYSKWKASEYNPEGYFVLKDRLFMNVIGASNGKRALPSIFSQFGISLRKYQIKIYDIDEMGVPHFIPYNNFFDDKYLIPTYITGYPKNAVSFAFDSRGAILEDSIIVKVGLYKTILQTRNNAKIWELISSHNGQPQFILNDSTYVFLNKDSYSNNPDRTFDYGNTILPTELYLDTLYYLITTKDTIGNVIDTLYENIDTVTYFTAYQKSILFYVDENGKGFWLGANSAAFENYPDFAYTLDYGRRFKFKRMKNLGALTNYKASNVVKIGDKYFFSIGMDRPSKYYDTLFYVLKYLDTNFIECKVRRPYKGPLFFVNYLLADNLEHFYMLGYAQDSTRLWRKRFEIRETSDSGETSIPIAEIDEDITISQFYEHNKDSVFFTAEDPARLYLFDRRRKVIDTLYKDSGKDKILLMIIADRWFLVGNGFILENTNRSDLTQWREGKWDYGKPNFESVIFKGNVAIAGLSDSVRPFNYYKITLKKDTTTSVEDGQVDVRYYTTHFYATEPYPMPASNVVKSRIYTDGSFDLYQALDGVYDSMGNKIEGKERITIKELGKATAELSWNCSGVPSGVYFIVVRHSGQADVIPVVVE